LRVRHVVIHCLPGLYGPFNATLPRIDPQSGLPFNGETWPVTIPSFVSIQGTSALDTIFDARRTDTHILKITDPNTTSVTHEESFIDSVTIRNAWSNSAVAGSGAGIYIHPSGMGASSRINVTNCFITNNTVGIGIDNFLPPSNVAQSPRIINNTIAWNTIGLWSGNTATGGVSDNNPTLLNNVFDGSGPTGLAGYITTTSGFEGVDATETSVLSRGGVPFNPPQDFNAWEDTVTGAFGPKVNRGALALLPAWPVTLPAGPLTTPRTNISLYTRSATGRPGVLYINDVFRQALGVDHSPHDFRLAPMCTRTSTPPGNQIPQFTWNPLADIGIDADLSQGTFPIVLTNDQLNYPPGLPPGSEGSATSPTRVDAWDNDAEGTDNPRFQNQAGFSAFPVIDLGADERGNLIIAGFLDGTRILTPENVPNAPGANATSNHGRIYFFARQEFNPWTRPQTNIYDAKVLVDWWGSVQGGPDADAGNYTTAAIGVRPGGSRTERNQDITFFGSSYEAFMRGLECDFTPHLAPDPHPYWGGWMTTGTPTYWSDIYGCNPWYDHAGPPNNVPFRRDNPALFHNAGGSSSTSWGGAFGGPVGMFVLDATINPPGTYPQGARWTLPPTTTLGPYTPCAGTSATTYNVGVWGFGDTAAGCPDMVPFIGNQLISAARFNCERLAPNGAATSNLQTFLVIHGPQTPINGAQSRGTPEGSRIQPTPTLTVGELRSIIRAALDRRR
jgi:hypothetical protein